MYNSRAYNGARLQCVAKMNMFDSGDDRVRLPVKMSLSDGRTLIGNLLANMGGTLERTLNNEALFVTFEDDEPERMFAKSTILEVLPRHKGEVARKDPPLSVNKEEAAHKTLGVGQDASVEEITHAFVSLAEHYRPDRFEGVNLPPEVAEYIDSKYRKLYAAHTQMMEGKTAVISQVA